MACLVLQPAEIIWDTMKSSFCRVVKKFYISSALTLSFGIIMGWIWALLDLIAFFCRFFFRGGGGSKTVLVSTHVDKKI